MASLLPGVETILRKTSTPPNPQDLASIAHFIGPSQSGPVNVPTTITTVNDLAQFGSGPTVEQAADALNVAGGPVYFTRSATTSDGALSAVTKTLGNPVGIASTAFGSVLVAGADNNGDVLINAKQGSVNISLIDAGVTTASTLVSVVGTTIQVTLKRSAMAITETGTGLASAINGNAPAFALVGAVAQGTGASIVGVLAPTTLDDGAIRISALTTGVSYRILLAGTNTTLSSTYSAGVLTLNLATNANGEPTTTATAAQAELAIRAAANPNTFTSSLVGAGSKLLGAKGSTSLSFGSTGAATVSGAPTDDYNFTVTVLRGGTVGGATPITVQWSCDNGALYSSQVVVPFSGILLLKDTKIDTNVTITFTGTFDIGDTFTFTGSGPVTGATDLYAAIDAAMADYTRQFGFITSPVVLDRAMATVVDSKLQAIRQNRNLYGLFSVRGPATGETETVWENAIINAFVGFVSLDGLLSLSAGTVLHVSTYSGREFVRNLIYPVASRAASIPVHEDLGRVSTGPMRNVIAIYHDESKSYGLSAQRFIVSRTFSTRPGQFYIQESPTMSDTSDVGYTLVEWVRVLLSVARISSDAALIFVNSSFGAIGQLDGTGAPLGALSVASANKIQKYVNDAVRLFIDKPKSDGLPSASDFSVTVLRNYSFLATREIRMEINVTPLGVARNIVIGINVNIPA